MGIFGQLDAANISSNPFYVEAGEYTGQVEKAEFKTNKDGNRQLVITYSILDEESEFFNQNVQQFFTLVDPDLTDEELKLLPPHEQQAIRRTNSNLKKTLCGQPNTKPPRKGLGVKEDDLNGDWDPKVLEDLQVNFAVYNFGDGNEGVGVRWVELKD